MKPRRLSGPCNSVDFKSPVSFRFDEKSYSGFQGDTLASALLANGVRTIGRSFKYHRRRGVFALGAEEPNALVEVGLGSRREPNTRATQIPLYEGLLARSQNRWPSLSFDVLSANDALSAVLGAGFYYKTFKWPRSLWPLYEHYIRRAAGLGTPPEAGNPAQFETRWHHTDVLVVGAGPAGLSAAHAARQCGSDVMLVDQASHPGGCLRFDQPNIDGVRGDIWATQIAGELSASAETIVLQDATALGIYDHNFVAVTQRLVPPGQNLNGAVSQRLWKVRAKQIVIATGAIERPLVLPGNDIPGVMLASAARGYLNAYSVAAGSQVVVVTNNDDAYRTAAAFAAAGLDVRAVLDSRDTLSDCARPFREKVRLGHMVSHIAGASEVHAVEARSLQGGATDSIACDLVCLSGGYTPSVHLHMHARGKLRWNEEIAAFVPAESVSGIRAAGGCNGRFDLAEVLAEGTQCGVAAAAACGCRSPNIRAFATNSEPPYRMTAFWRLPVSWKRRDKAFVDLQNDVTEKDIAQARDEGYVSVEHLKRYTTLGMGTDQGKTSNINGLALMAIAGNRAIPDVGTTTFRPPFTPVTLGVLAGGRTGADVVPVRRTPLAEMLSHEGAVFVNSGRWKRAWYFPKQGESLAAAARREARAVRQGVGMTEISTLGKFEISGAGAADLLDRIYATPMRSLAVGRARWGLMLREDGMVFDDGTLWRLAKEKYLVTASTANASAILSHLEFVRDVVMPDLDVDVACVSEQWAGVAVAGPRSRDVVTRLFDSWRVPQPLPEAPLEFRRCDAGDIPLLVARLSFSGERCYEIYVPAGQAQHLWQALREAGSAFGIIPYGLESLELLRVEKGFLGSGHEINGRTTPDDLGLRKMLKKHDNYLGAAGLRRPALGAEGRLQLVGLVARSGELPEGAQLVASDSGKSREPDGYVTSAAYSVSLQSHIALALLADGRSRHGEMLVAADPVRSRASKVQVVPPTIYDPEGAALHG